jgi:hypothetical protein
MKMRTGGFGVGGWVSKAMGGRVIRKVMNILSIAWIDY